MNQTSENDPRFGIEELAERGGVSRRTVRYYVQRGLLPSPTGTGRGPHYTQDHLDTLVRIRELQEAGVGLAEIPVRLGYVPNPPGRQPGPPGPEPHPEPLPEPFPGPFPGPVPRPRPQPRPTPQPSPLPAPTPQPPPGPQPPPAPRPEPTPGPQPQPQPDPRPLPDPRRPRRAGFEPGLEQQYSPLVIVPTVPFPEPRGGSNRSVWTHIALADGIELRVREGRTAPTPAQLVRLEEAICDILGRSEWDQGDA